MAGEAAHMHLIDDQLFQRGFQGPVPDPVEIIMDHHRPLLVDGFHSSGGGAPLIAPADQPRVRIEQDRGRVKMMAQVRLVGTIHAVAVFDLLLIEIEDDHGEDIAQLESFGEGDLHQRLSGPFFKEDQGAGGGVAGENSEIDAAGHDGSRQKDTAVRPAAENLRGGVWGKCRCAA